ncbi:MAG: MFS transporter, partial [Alphaproteobacteria bacterium]|nr:MFS transporter [Alphaproteobacteria bacterium]
IHGRATEAGRIIAEIEARVVAATGAALRPAVGRLRVSGRGRASFAAVAKTLIRTHPRRTLLGLILITTQAFFYNAIFFTYALVLTKFYDVQSGDVGRYMLPFAVGNFCGPLLLGRFFDSIGRKPMIGGTYAISGLLLAGTALLFMEGRLDAVTQTVAWTGIFFFASAAASAAYLTVAECFPLEIRALSIALFYAVGTLLGGVAAPWFFGRLIETGDRQNIVWGYLFGAVLMLVGAAAEFVLGIKAERRSLEDVARPLSAEERAA